MGSLRWSASADIPTFGALLASARPRRYTTHPLSPVPTPPALSLRELLLAAVLALTLGVVVVGRSVWDGELVYCATDTATVQAPWHAAPRARNPELSDQGVAFYPVYRRVAERWGAGEVPLWTPDLELGLPLLANPQWGVLDPQVLALVLLEELGGWRLFDRGFAWLALLRVAGAALGAYLLARRLALGPRGAALAGVGFALSGSLLLWLGYSLGHVIPWLPWLLLAIEAQRGRRRGLAFGATAGTMALSLYGGHPETAFFVGLAAALWIWRGAARDRAAALWSFAALAVGVLLAAPMWLPFLEYLESSGALLAHRMEDGARTLPDLISLGALLAFAGFLFHWRGSGGERLAPFPLRVALLWLAALGLLALLRWRGLELSAHAGEGAFIERASGWLPLPVLALALVALLGGGAPLRRRGEVILLGVGALLLSLEIPGVVDLWRWLPLVGLAAPARAACVAALFLSLAAGAALERSGSLARTGAFGGVLLVGGFLFAGSRGEASPPSLAVVDPADEVVVYDELPPVRAGDEEARLAGELRGGLPLDSLVLSVERLDDRGEPGDARFTRAATLGSPDAEGTRRFDFGRLDLAALAPGDWRFRLEFRRDGVPFASRVAAVTRVEVERGPGVQLVVVAIATLGLLALGWKGVGALALLALSLLQGIHLSWGWNPAVPRAEHFSLTKTEAFIGREYRGERFLADTGILPGDTVLVHGLTTVGGYDAMNVATFDGFRAYALKEGANPLLDWTASGIEPASPAFQLLGVRLLLFHERRSLPGWHLVAGPHDAPAESEVWILAADDPVPRAFCVSRIVSRTSALGDPAGFDARHSAFLEENDPLAIDDPFECSEVELVSRSAHTLEYEVELDGEGLFVLTEQHYPGWRATVDGEERPILRADSVFRALNLDAGVHRVRFEYAPESWRIGRFVGLLGLVLLVGGVIAARRGAPRA